MSIVPVDLNAFLYRAAKIIANFYHIIGNEKMVGFYLAYLHSTYLPLFYFIFERKEKEAILFFGLNYLTHPQ